MNEATLTSSLMDACDAAMPDGVGKKHADNFTIGIPDFSYTWGGRTVWVEVKYLRDGKKLANELKPIQLTTCAQLEQASHGHCWIVVYESTRLKLASIYRPTQLLQQARMGEGAMSMTFTTTTVTWSLAAVCIEGFDHARIAQFFRSRIVGPVIEDFIADEDKHEKQL